MPQPAIPPVPRKRPTERARERTRYVESKDAVLELATSIAEAQEDKSRLKVERSQHSQTGSSSQRPHHASDPKRSGNKLKQAKALIVAQKAKLKKEKAKVKKESKRREQTSNSEERHQPISKDPGPTRKKKTVSFA